MLVQIITENGQKKVIPLTTDTGVGNPVGTIIPMYKKSSPSGYLYCDGSTFDETKYPLLYAYLGSNVLPDYRECAIVGAEQNGTDTIAKHDVYTQGQFKDDQLQNHGHSINDPGHTHTWSIGGQNPGGGQFIGYTNSSYTAIARNTGSKTTGITIGSPNSGRHGDVTRGKRKAVYFYIKATSGLSENAQDNVVAQLNEERSYSTSEVNTGKKWIDGKPIYRKTIDCGALPNATSKAVAHNITNVDFVVSMQGVASIPGGNKIPLPFVDTTTFPNEVQMYTTSNDVVLRAQGNRSNYTNTYVTIEYTKTTD